MNLRKGTSVLKTILISIFLASIILLAFTVIRSGYFFEFDLDELYHANTVYLISQGYKPFTDFFLPYSPLFYSFLSPLFHTSGFTLDTIQATRVVMIILFVLRILGASLLIRTLFGKLAAFLFLPLFLLDPFTAYVSMQIRPDNFMMTIYIIGLVVLIHGFIAQKKYVILLAGIILGISLIASIKIVPSLGALFLVLFFYRLRYKFAGLLELCIGISLPIVLFSLYYLFNGAFVPMITNLVFDARAINESLKYPVPMGNFYWPSPSTIFGLSFKPILFQYVWALPLLAFAGAYNTFITSDFTSHTLSRKNMLSSVLAVSLGVQWISLFFIRSVFIQYYIPLTWLFALFGAVAIATILHKVKSNKALYIGTLLLFSGVYCLYLAPSIQANYERAKVIGKETKESILSIWRYIPENQSVYPGVLFRPLAYPIPYGFTYYDLPQSLFRRYAPIEHYLEKNNVKYLNIHERAWALPNEVMKQYVTRHYIQDDTNSLFWVKK